MQKQNKQQARFYVGSYTHPEGHVPNACGSGIYRGLINLDSGEIELTVAYEGIKNPSYIDVDQETKQVYAIEEVEGKSNVAQLLNMNGDTLICASEQSTLSEASCHVFKHKNSLYVASYVGGSLTQHKIEGDQLLSGKLINYTGSGPNPARQEASHAHQSIASPDDRWLYVCDLGSDRIWCHDLQKPFSEPTQSIVIPPGYGPRHLCFHPYLSKVFAICEMAGIILVFDYDANTGALNLSNEHNSLPSDYTELPSSGAIRIHPSGHALYVSNRGHESVGAFAIDKGGQLESMGWVNSGGVSPRDFNIDPSGQWLLTANQDSHTITVFKINEETKAIDESSIKSYECKSPCCIVFT